MSEPSKYPQKEIERFHDVFHEQGDDMDEEKDENIDFDNLYQNFLLTTDESEISVNEINDADDRDHPIIDLIGEEEQEQQAVTDEHVESEQSSTTKKRPSLTPTTPSRAESTATTKKKRTEVDEEVDANLPRFLSHTNPVFEETMHPLLEQTANSIKIEHVRKIALLKFKIAVNDLDISLWDTYLRSGTGKLEVTEENPQLRQRAVTTTITTATTTTTASISDTKVFIWPDKVKTKLMASGSTTFNHINDIDDDSCLNYVYIMLRQFRDQNTQYYQQLKERKQHLNDSWTLEIEETIDKFVEQYGTTFHRIPNEGLISSVKYQYKDRLLQLEFYQQDPREYQSEVFENLCKEKYDKETAKLELAILKQRIVHNHLPSSFESLHIPQPISLANIQNQLVRQRLSERYHKILQRTKSDMMQVYVATQEAQAEEYRQKFDQDWLEMKENLRCGPTHKKFTPTMIDILQRRFRNTDNHLLYLYKQKMHFFDKAPTVKN